MHPTLRLIFLCSLALSLLSACNKAPEHSNAPAAAPKAEKLTPKPLEWPPSQNLRVPPKGMTASTLTPSPPVATTPCHLTFEKHGKPRESLPFKTSEQLGIMLFGCNIEAYKTHKTHRYFAYSLPTLEDHKAPNLRVVSYTKDNTLRWQQTIDRSEQDSNFLSNFRNSFLTPVGGYLICAGTAWEGGVQAECFKDVDGKKAWNGKLPYWSGFTPTTAAKSLVVAGLAGIQHIYPWSGVERRFLKLRGGGGRTAVYAYGGPSKQNNTLFFGANMDAPFHLSAYDLETLRELWLRKLPTTVSANNHKVFPQHDLLLLSVKERVVGLDTRTGDPLFGFRAGNKFPLITANDSTLFVISAKKPNMLFALEPRTARVKAWADYNKNVTRMQWLEGHLYLATENSVERITGFGAKP